MFLKKIRFLKIELAKTENKKFHTSGLLRENFLSTNENEKNSLYFPL